MAGVSVRTLHYYDKIGLLVPASRTFSGYRNYTHEDLLRLQQILIGRELGLTLEQIRRALDDPAFDLRQALLAQRKQLEERARQTAGMIAAVDAALAMIAESREEAHMDRIFDGFSRSKHEAEAQQRWGHTDAFKEAARRTKGYTKEQWAELRAEEDAIYSQAAALMKAGSASDHEQVRAIAERHRLMIERWFYPCSPETHAALASMYESDARFAAAIDKHSPGLTAFLAAAIRANCSGSRASG